MREFKYECESANERTNETGMIQNDILRNIYSASCILWSLYYICRKNYIVE